MEKCYKKLSECDKKLRTCDLLMFAIEISTHDTRIERCKRHEGRTIAFIVLCAVICGCRTWDDICEYGKSKKTLMEEYLGPLESTPSADTIGRFFALIKPESFEGVFRCWMAEILRLRKSPKGECPDGEIIAVDGKELRGAAAAEGSPVRVVSAFAVDAGLSLGQETVGEKTNEIPAVRKLVSELDIKGCTVTADAMHCQKDTCKAIVEGGGDFLLFAKGNQKSLMGAVKDAVDTAMNNKRVCQDSRKNYTGKAGKNFCIRTCMAVGDMSLLGSVRKEWPWVKSCGAITLEKDTEEGIVKETRYFIASFYMDAARALKTARKHWGVENGLHWRLDVDFDEDASRKRKNAATNFSLVSKMAMAVLRTDLKKEPLRRKMLRASLNDEYLRQLLDNFKMNL